LKEGSRRKEGQGRKIKEGRKERREEIEGRKEKEGEGGKRKERGCVGGRVDGGKRSRVPKKWWSIKFGVENKEKGGEGVSRKGTDGQNVVEKVR
jgi:hypothetical protein